MSDPLFQLSSLSDLNKPFYSPDLSQPFYPQDSGAGSLARVMSDYDFSDRLLDFPNYFFEKEDFFSLIFFDSSATIFTGFLAIFAFLLLVYVIYYPAYWFVSFFRNLFK